MKNPKNMSENDCKYDDYEPAPIWLNKSFIEDALKQYRNDDSLQVDSIEIKPATAKGENYASLMYRCKVNYTTAKRNGVFILKSFNYTIKFNFSILFFSYVR